MMKNNATPDQTQFVAESPLFEGMGSDVPEQALLGDALEELKQKKNRKMIIGLVVLLLIVLSIFISLRLRQKTNIGEIDVAEDEVLTEVVVGPFNQRLSDLKNELEAADPNQEELPFPPIDREINLEE